MKIVSYNINDSYQWKIDRLLEMEADIFVVPEISCPEQICLPDEYDMKWNGISWKWNNKKWWKGLGVIWKKGKGFVPDWYNHNLFYGIPLLIDDILILAFWPTKRDDVYPGKVYPQLAQEIISEYSPYFKEKKVLIIGDFNCYVNQSDKTKEYGDVLRINDMLESYGLHSVYHKMTDETFGKETIPTYYHHFKENWSFFIDYAYTNMHVESYKLLPWDSKMSDHVGQVIEII